LKRLNRGTVPPFEMHPRRAVPPFKIHLGETVPSFKMQPEKRYRDYQILSLSLKDEIPNIGFTLKGKHQT